MKVKEIIESLQKKDQEQEVLLYMDETEEYGSTDEIALVMDKDDLPYAKGDYPEMTDKGVLLVKGWVM